MNVGDRTWACTSCTFENPSRMETCLQCDGERPTDLPHGKKSRSLAATIQCDWPGCGSAVLLAEYNAHASKHERDEQKQKEIEELASQTLIKQITSEDNNDHDNARSANATIYNAEPAPTTVECDYPDCGETVLFSEYAVHTAKHDQVKPVRVKCDFRGCGKTIPYNEYAEHGRKHTQNNNNGNRYRNRCDDHYRNRNHNVMDKGNNNFFAIFQLLFGFFTFVRLQACLVGISMAIVTSYAENVVRGVLYLSIMIICYHLVKYSGIKFGPTVKNNIKSKLKWNNNLGNVPTVVWILFIIIFGVLCLIHCQNAAQHERLRVHDARLDQHDTKLNQHDETLRQHDKRIGIVEHGLAQLQHQMLELSDAFFDLTKRVGDVETFTRELKSGLMKTAAKVDEQFDFVQTKIQESYDGLLKKYEMARWADEIMMNTIGRIKSDPRKWIGIGGCFIEETQIAVGTEDEDSEFVFVNVEQLQSGDYVYNPFLKKNMKIRRWIYGYETGIIYNVTTSDGLSVVVTQTHPMIICHENEVDIIVSVNYNGANCMNVPAKDIFVGNNTMTMNGKQEIIKIDQIKVKDAVVYNFMYLDGEDELPVMYRGVNANGIYTLDLYAQSLHNTTEDNGKSGATGKICLLIVIASFLWQMSKRDF